jgi:type IV fimbrial biogenesis protein FimT
LDVERHLLDQKEGRGMLTRRLVRGVTLVEMLIGLAVLGLLLSLAVPSFMVWMQNTQIRNAADAVLNGLQLARSEAIRRNKPVQFALTSQSGWRVQIVKPSAGEKKTVQQRYAAEGSASVNVAPTPGGAYAVTFDTMGGPTGNLDGSLPLNSLRFTSQVSNPAIRSLNIVVSQSGTIRMCDPNVPATDARSC